MKLAAGLLALLAACAGCAPALDWRESRPEGAGVSMLFPCKPASHARTLPLAGGVVRLHLSACSADGMTWALAHADLGDPGRVAAALKELQRAAAANLGAPEPGLRPQSIPGATPQPQSGRLDLKGRGSDGAPIASHAVFFSRGTVVYQATVLGPAPPEAALEQFFSGIRLISP